MANLNFTHQILIYEDASDTNPKIRIPDITRSVQGVSVGNDKSERMSLAPGEVKNIVTTARSLAWDSSTQLTFERYNAAADYIRIKWTGTGSNPIFRTVRNIGGSATTNVTISRVSPYVARITNTAGTAWTLGTVQTGDFIRFEKNTDSFSSPFSSTNQGKTYQVQVAGSNYIDFIDNGESALDTSILLGANFSFNLLDARKWTNPIK